MRPCKLPSCGPEPNSVDTRLVSIHNVSSVEIAPSDSCHVERLLVAHGGFYGRHLPETMPSLVSFGSSMDEPAIWCVRPGRAAYAYMYAGGCKQDISIHSPCCRFCLTRVESGGWRCRSLGNLRGRYCLGPTANVEAEGSQTAGRDRFRIEPPVYFVPVGLSVQRGLFDIETRA